MIARPGDFEHGDHPGSSRRPRFWTVADLLSWTEGYFNKLGLANPRLDAELLLADAMGTSRLELYTGYRKVVEEDERARYRELVERRARFEPVAYILGVREFYSLAFEVDETVLIPRPETEHLVDRVLEIVKKKPPETAINSDHVLEDSAPAPEIRLLDIGTGSGNVVIAILKHLPQARAVAIDMSPEALEVARRNARKHEVESRIEFVVGDLFEPLEWPPAPKAGAVTTQRFDIIVSNPPYVRLIDYPTLMRDVRDYEPSLALLDKKGGDGLGFYREIIEGAARYLNDGGLLAFEVGALQAQEVEGMLRGRGWENIHAMADYAGIQRVISATRPPVQNWQQEDITTSA